MKTLLKVLRASPDAVPYGDITVKLLDSIFAALRYCAKQYLSDAPLHASDNELISCFSWLNPTPHSSANRNRHLLEGIKGINKGIPRLASLTVWRFKEIQRNAKYPKDPQVVSLLAPSPLSILYDALVVPEEPASRAFALAACRRLLFIRMKVYPSQQVKGSDWRTVDVDDIESELDAQRRYFEHRDNLPVAAGVTAEMLQHFLGLKGYYCLRFGTWKKKNLANRNLLRKIVDAYFKQKDILGFIAYKGRKGRAFEFRRSPLVVDPPRGLEIINELVGVPLPIRGTDTLFYGGLRFSNNDSIVLNVYGAAGTGKTSLALATAATLSPYGTRCYYITTEEAREDLEVRLRSLIPAYMRGLSIFKPISQLREWFHVADLSSLKNLDHGSSLGKGLSMHLAEVSALVESTRRVLEKQIEGSTTVPAICPLIVVIDSIFGLTQGQDRDELESLSEFIAQCRQLKALVIVLSGEELPRHSRLSYMVDVLIRLSYQGTDSEASKPERILQLVKTRFQLSRPGAHVFHMSGREGFRISPQLPSQLDKEEQQNLTMPDEEQVINVLNRWSGAVSINDERMEKVTGVTKFLDLYSYSHILIHGHGSSGKAGFGLKILLDGINKGETYKDIGVEPRRVLVVSFLYPSSFYEAQYKGIKKEIQADCKLTSSCLECLAFSPGFLPPEDLVGKVSRRIEEADLRGKPFTGVLLDGIHNVFLSFPVLQKREMLWPTLYRMLSINKLTIVTTFTTFVLNLKETKDISEEREMWREGQTPLLHAIVQAADFYLSLNPLPPPAESFPESLLTVNQAIGEQPVPRFFLLWDRSHGRLSPPVRWKEGKEPDYRSENHEKEKWATSKKI